MVPVHIVFLNGSFPRTGCLVERNTEYLEALVMVLLVNGFYVGNFTQARTTPRSPEVEQYIVSAQARQRKLGTVGSHQRNVGSRTAYRNSRQCLYRIFQFQTGSRLFHTVGQSIVCNLYGIERHASYHIILDKIGNTIIIFGRVHEIIDTFIHSGIHHIEEYDGRIQSHRRIFSL